MKDYQASHKKAALKKLSVKLNMALASPSCDESLVESLLRQIRALVMQLRGILRLGEMRRILGVGALLIGLTYSPKANAQYFGEVFENPYGLITTKGFSVPSFVDLDRDGDFDILVGEAGGDFEYFENIGSTVEPNYGAPQYNPFGLKSADQISAPAFADLDNDGDFDLIVGERYGNLQYFENIGTANKPEFAEPVANPFGLEATYYNAFPVFADFDSDGDQDILVGEYYGNLQYFENVGTAEEASFAVAKENPFGLEAAIEIAVPAAADVDLDGDIDLLVGEKNGFVKYYENGGTPEAAEFKEALSSPFGIKQTLVLACPTFADLDGDGDADLLMGEDEGKMYFYENTIISSTPDWSDQTAIDVFPNPATDRIFLEASQNITSVELYNAMGQMVLKENQPNQSVSIGALPTGIYVMRLTDTEGQTLEKRIQKL